MNGLRSVLPARDCGNKMYKMEKRGNMTPIRTTSKLWSSMFFLLKPGRPSYQIDANSCCTFGWATNYTNWTQKITIFLKIKHKWWANVKKSMTPSSGGIWSLISIDWGSFGLRVRMPVLWDHGSTWFLTRTNSGYGPRVPLQNPDIAFSIPWYWSISPQEKEKEKTL